MPERRRSLRAALLACALGALAPASPRDARAAAVQCVRWAAEATRTGSVPAALAELSGMAASRRHPGVYWGHNDSNNAGALFAIDASGKVLARHPIRGLRPRDTEDVAVGPCAPGSTKSCIYLADTGDNLTRRKEVWIARVPEPERLDGRTLVVEADSFRYPDGARNSESLLVDPNSAQLYVITKSVNGLGDVFRLDRLGSKAGGRAVPVATLPAPAALARLTTAADAHPDGDRVLLRTYAGVWELRRPGAKSLAAVFGAKPVEVTGAPQLQSEAIAYAPDGASYLLAAEGARTAIYRVDCADPAPAR